MIIIENFYEGWGGIRGVEGAPLAPWETQTEIPADPITPTVPTTPVVPITNSIYLPTIQTKAQTPHSDGQAMDTRHPMEVAHPDHVAYTVAMPYNDMAIAAAGVLPAVVYGGRALTRSLPPQAVRPIHQAINSLQTEIDVARVRADWALQDAKEWLQERLGQGRDSA